MLTGEDALVGRDEALRALRRKVTRHEFEFATVLEVADGGPAGFCCVYELGSASKAAKMCQPEAPAASPSRSTATKVPIGTGP